MQRGMCIGLVVAGALVVAALGRAAKLDTSTLTGHWVGSYHNDTLNSGGTIDVVTSPLGDSGQRVDWAFTGVLFGCPQDGSPVGGALLKGSKESGYTGSKIIVKGDDSVFGHVTIKNKGTKFFGRGKNPCNGVAAKSYKATAKLVNGTLSGNMSIVLAGGGKAKATLTATKQ